jgi:nicotinamidase-related amidase
MAVELGALVAPGRTALIIQEGQRGVIGDESALPELARAARETGVIDRIAELAVAARAAGVAVVHATAENLDGGFGVNRNARLFAGARRNGALNAPGSTSVLPLPELGPEPGDVVLPRYHGLSPLTGGPLDSLLRNEGITTIVVTGVSLNVAIPNVVFDGVNRSYQVIVPTDAVVAAPAEYGEHILRNTIGLIATLVSTADLVDAWKDASGAER